MSPFPSVGGKTERQKTKKVYRCLRSPAKASPHGRGAPRSSSPFLFLCVDGSCCGCCIRGDCTVPLPRGLSCPPSRRIWRRSSPKCGHYARPPKRPLREKGQFSYYMKKVKRKGGCVVVDKKGRVAGKAEK